MKTNEPACPCGSGRVMAAHPQQVVTPTQLVDKVWGMYFYADESTATVHIRRLRTKIETDPANPRHVVTVRGLGYKSAP